MRLRDAVETTKQVQQRTIEPLRKITRGELIAVGGSVDVIGRPGYAWVREYGQSGGISQVFNPTVQSAEGLAVLIGHTPKAPYRRIILDVNWEMIADSPDYPGDPYLPMHHETHEWADGLRGSDAVTIYGRSLSMLRTYYQAGLAVGVTPLRYEQDGEIAYFVGHETLDISGDQPAAGLARYIMIYLDTDTNTIQTVAGDTAIDVETIIPPMPDAPQYGIPSAWVRLDGDATNIGDGDIVDARLIINEITGQMVPILASIAAAEEELDYDISRHIVEHALHLTGVLAFLEAEYDYNQSRHVVQG